MLPSFGKKISRRSFLQAASLAATAGFLAACSPAPSAPAATEEPTAKPPSNESVKVTVWGWWAERMNFFQEAGNKFTQENPEVTVEVITIDQDLWTKVFASVPAGTGPTLCKMMTDNYFKMRQLDLLLELDEMVFGDDYLKQKFPNHAWNSYGRYVIPEGNQGAVMIYNKEMFANAGLSETAPKTWDEFVNAAVKTSVTDSSGLLSVEGCGFDDWLPVLNMLYQQGGMVVTREGDTMKANFETPEMVKSWQFFADAAFKHKYWDKDFPYFTEAIGTEKAASTICEAWGWGDIKSSYPDVHAKLAAAAPPTPTGQAAPYYGRQNSVLGLASIVNRPENETNAGRKFIEYLYTQDLDSQFALSSISGLVPAHADNMGRKEIAEDPFLSLMKDIVSKEYDTVDIGGGFSDVFYTAMDMLIINQDSAETVAAYCQSEIQTKIDNGDILFTQ